MESLIDQKYRLILMQCHLDGIEEKPNKIKFYCPFCQPQRPSGKFIPKKGGMFWIPQWNTWRFNCLRCLPMTGMYQYLIKLNLELGKRYQQEPFHSGTTGKGHDCPNPKDQELSALVGVSTGA